jgi:hypothetical protein
MGRGDFSCLRPKIKLQMSKILTDAVGLYKLNLETILTQMQVLATHTVPPVLPAGIYLALILLLFFHHIILFGPAHLSFHTPLYLHFQ